MFGGSGSLIVALLFSSPKTADTLQGLVHLDQSSIKTVLYGVSISVGMYVSQQIWLTSGKANAILLIQKGTTLYPEITHEKFLVDKTVYFH
jgi:hypothetical protein